MSGTTEARSGEVGMAVTELASFVLGRLESAWNRSDGAAFGELFAADSDARQLQVCLSELDERSRGVIVLAFVHGLSHAQLAARLSHPLGTVKTWIRGGLKRLRVCLADAVVRA